MITDLTPEAARAAAAWLDEHYDSGDGWPPSAELRNEADRLEAASRLDPDRGREVCDIVMGGDWWQMFEPRTRERWNRAVDVHAAAVIARHVDPDRVVVVVVVVVVVDRKAVLDVLAYDTLGYAVRNHFEKALS